MLVRGAGGHKTRDDQIPTGADAVAANALLQEVRGHRLGEADDGRLGGAVDAAVDHASRGCRPRPHKRITGTRRM